MLSTNRSAWRVLALCFAAGMLSLPARTGTAATITYGLDFEFSGGVPPTSGTTPWVTATFDDSFGGANTVRLTMSAPNLTGGSGGENIAGLYFNFDPALDPTLLAFSVVDNTDSVPNSISTGVNAFMADGDGKFDILFDFPPPPGNGASRFTQGETVIYDLTYIAPITASSFAFDSVEGGGNGSYGAAAHILRTGSEGLDSGWVGNLPEPGTAVLTTVGLLMLLARSRSARRER